MEISRRKLATMIAMVALASTLTAYALNQVIYQVPSTVSIAGIGLEVHWWVEGNQVGDKVTAMDFGLVTPPSSSVGYKPGNPSVYRILLVADCNGVNEKVTWSSDLSPSVGTVTVQIEQWQGAYLGWVWIPLPQNIILTNHQVLGFRPREGDQQEGDYGYMRILFQAANDAPHGDYTFTITFTGTQV